jgi:hypothetical protein
MRCWTGYLARWSTPRSPLPVRPSDRSDGGRGDAETPRTPASQVATLAASSQPSSVAPTPRERRPLPNPAVGRSRAPASPAPAAGLRAALGAPSSPGRRPGSGRNPYVSLERPLAPPSRNCHGPCCPPDLWRCPRGPSRRWTSQTSAPRMTCPSMPALPSPRMVDQQDPLAHGHELCSPSSPRVVPRHQDDWGRTEVGDIRSQPVPRICDAPPNTPRTPPDVAHEARLRCHHAAPTLYQN